MGKLSPYAKEFFMIFLKQKLEFKKPVGWAFFRPYDGMNIKLGLWPLCSWNEAHVNRT
jgi:hypothetical protein